MSFSNVLLAGAAVVFLSCSIALCMVYVIEYRKYDDREK